MHSSSNASNLSALKSRELALLQERLRRLRTNKLTRYYTDTGPYRRELYQKHLAWFAAGGEHAPHMYCPADCDGQPHRERLALGANRTGKTEGLGGYETTLHLTGLYPSWWPGKVFERPIHAWAAGDTLITTRDIQQAKLLGPPEALGTGLIPEASIVDVVSRSGVPNAFDQVTVKHARSGGQSILSFKSYEQGRATFQGTERDVIWLDEECPREIYEECVVRTMATGAFDGGLMLLTFTPLKGMTEVVLAFLEHGEIPAVLAA